MAYPEVSGPYGLVPVKRLDGNYYNGATRQYKIASGYATSIFNGDLVKIVTGGTIERETADAAIVTCGVFVGCQYTDPSTSTPIWKNYYPASTSASDIMAFVVDDPEILFKVAVVSATTVIGDYALTDLGANAALVDNTGDTLSGKSRVAVSHTSATTDTLPVRIIELVEETKNASGGYTEALVKINTVHQHKNLTGV